ncbi:MAG TPA: arylamine N-acetyltransferase [Candidatus Aquilonibacter sp.]|nr:arylamine N-acetyltransferase [Candidatus Aquilonibacter sp.]
MNRLHQYLRRIEYGGPLHPSRQTLHALHRAHLLAIPFENVDVQLREKRPFTLDAVFEKIVEQRRGGWCYEMNGLFGWALGELGFKADYIACAVDRQKNGDRALMNHLALIVHLDQPFLADVGFGNGLAAPMPLREGTFNDGRFDFRLTRDGDWWRFHNHRLESMTYDFTQEPHAYEQFEHKARMLATTAESPFVQNLIAIKLLEDGMVRLTNAAFTRYDANEMVEETAPNAAELARILKEHFDLRPANIEALWNRVSSQHKTWLRKRIRGF